MFTTHDLVLLAAFEIVRAGDTVSLRVVHDRANDYYLALSAVYPSTLSDGEEDFQRLFALSRAEFVKQVWYAIAALTQTPPVMDRLRERLHEKSYYIAKVDRCSQ